VDFLRIGIEISKGLNIDIDDSDGIFYSRVILKIVSLQKCGKLMEGFGLPFGS
jgi:hypothetical protein